MTNETKGILRTGLAFAAVLVLTLASLFMSLQKTGIYDYFDGIRYLANGVSLLSDAKGTPLPIAYAPQALPDAFADQKQLTYPSVIFQLWAAVTAGLDHPSLLWVGIAGCILFAVHNVFFLLLARRFLPLVAALAVTALICFNPADSLLPRVMARPLPDGFLMVASTASAYLAVAGFYASAGIAAGFGSLLRFQGLLILWSNAFLAGRKFQALLYLAVWVGVFVVGSIFINLALAHYTGIHGDQNSGFYTSILESQSWMLVLKRIPSDVKMTMIALLDSRQYPLYLLATPFIIAGYRLTDNRTEKRFLVFSIVSAQATSFISFHALTIASGEGYADRYLVYPGPIVLLATVISFRSLFSRFRISSTLITGLLLLLATGTFALHGWRLRHDVTFWNGIYLPDAKLSVIPPNATVGIAAAEEAGYEIYAVTKARKLMWLPEAPTTFETHDNRAVDYLLIGGYWDHGADKPWIALAKREQPISDGSGSQFEFLQQTDYYWIYKRRSGNDQR